MMEAEIGRRVKTSKRKAGLCGGVWSSVTPMRHEFWKRTSEILSQQRTSGICYAALHHKKISDGCH